MTPDWLLGREWRTRGFRQAGWLLLPLRAFLGVTFTVAALQKLANPAFFNAHDPTSIQAQTRSFQHNSPIGGLVGIAAHHAALLGLLIAVGELAVGLATTLGLWARAAAVAGALLSLTFFLTVSWNATPYYYGADIVFLFAWTPFIVTGAAGVLSLDTVVAARARREFKLRPEAAVIGLTATRVREICPRQEHCGLGRDGSCNRVSRCPVLGHPETLRADLALEVNRRTLLRGGQLAAVVAGAGVVLGGLTAAAGRVLGGTHGGSALGNPLANPPGSTPAATGSAQPSSPPASGSANAPGTAIGRTSQVPVGQAASFTDPASGQPAWIVHPSGVKFVAFSAVCTHGGCSVQFDQPSLQFQCPCHGGVFDALTGQVIAGPPPSPLPSIPVHIVDGNIRVD
ncbi:MAG TPA: Rieske 2Fe-2S domain-containing protein [Mycobacteriales bacterium]|nr:Rieske 2Fe-2S domain-containing protein [Mycobacteriales bacterium]